MYSSSTPRLSPALLPVSNSPSPRNAVQHLLRILCTSAPIQRKNLPSNPITLNPPTQNPINDLHPPLLRPKPQHPAYLEKILTLQMMGFDTDQILRKNPHFRDASLSSVIETLFYLQSKGIRTKDLVHMVLVCPDIVTANTQNDFAPVFNFLSEDLQVEEENFHLVVRKCPRMLVTSVRDQLKPALEFLQRLGIKDKDLLAYEFPTLLVLNLKDTVIPKLNFFASIGFSQREVELLVCKRPDILTLSLDNNIKPKTEYFLKEIKGSLEELRCNPKYFSYCLNRRIKRRHKELVKKGIDMPIGVMLKITDVEFRNLVMQLEKEYSTKLSDYLVE